MHRAPSTVTKIKVQHHDLAKIHNYITRTTQKILVQNKNKLRPMNLFSAWFVIMLLSKYFNKVVKDFFHNFFEHNKTFFIQVIPLFNSSEF